MTETLEPCPFCATSEQCDVWIDDPLRPGDPWRAYVVCPRCGAHGPDAYSADGARRAGDAGRRAWNQRPEGSDPGGAGDANADIKKLIRAMNRASLSECKTLKSAADARRR